MRVVRGVVQRSRSIGPACADSVKRRQPEFPFLALKRVAVERRWYGRRVQSRAEAIADVAVEIAVVRGGLGEEGSYLTEDALIDGGRDGLLIEFDIGVVGMDRSKKRRRVRHRHGIIGAEAGARAAHALARKIAEPIQCRTRFRKRRTRDQWYGDIARARRIVGVGLRLVEGPDVLRARRAHVPDELYAPGARMRAVDDAQRNRHRHGVAVCGRLAVRFPLRREGRIFA